MATEQFHDPGRASDHTMPDRRRLAALIVALGMACITGSPRQVASGKKKRKRCKKKWPPSGQPPSCVGLCDSGCNFCYRRNAASNLCGGTLQPSVPCKPCATDNDCLGTNQPYCVSAQTTLATGGTDELACPGNPVGICGKPAPC